MSDPSPTVDPRMEEVLISVTDLRVRIGTLYPVDGVTFTIAPGETLALIGESGCGKSLTALALMGLLPVGADLVGGRIAYRGRDLRLFGREERRTLRGGRLAMVFQEPMSSLNPVMSVGDQVEEAVRLHAGLRGAEARRRVVELLEAVGIGDAERRADAYPHQLSGGLKQRVMIAMALAGDPDLLIADEPTTALDVTIQAQILDLLAELRDKRGMALLLITHDLGVAAHIADRLAVMYAGQIVEQGPRDAFFTAPAHPYSQMLFRALPDVAQRGHVLAAIPGQVPDPTQRHLGCRFAARCDRHQPRCDTDVPAWYGTAEWGVRCHLGEQGPIPFPETTVGAVTGRTFTATAEPLLEVSDLSVSFSVRQGFRRQLQVLSAVERVSFSLAAGRTLALVGESGCGKTTVAKAVMQLVAAESGTIRFAGQDLAQLDAESLRKARAGFQLIFQDPFASLNPRMRVRDMFVEAMEVQNIGADRPARLARAGELMEQVGLRRAQLGQYPHQFSGGQRQRLCIARALAVQPRLVVCDEPTSALDVSVQAQILNLLRRLQDEQGLSYLFITHDLAVVGYLADEIAVMYLGRIVEQGPADRVLAAPHHPYTQALLAAVPSPAAERKPMARLSGDIPSPLDRPAGCHFHPRCPLARPDCRRAFPARQRVAEDHYVNCVLYS